MPEPVLSVIVPCYNHGDFAAEAVASVRAQEVEAEILLVDDGSTDGKSPEQLEALAAPDCRVLHKENGGAASAMNHGIRAARAPVILRLDADDRLLPGYAKAALAALDRNARLGIVYCRARFFGRRSGEWRLPEYTLPGMLRRNLVFSAAFFRRADWERSGGYCEELAIREDYDFWLSLLELGREVLRLEEIYFEYRRHTERRRSKSYRAKRLQEARVYDAIRRRHASLYARHTEVLFDMLLDFDLREQEGREKRIGARLGRVLRGLRPGG